MARILEYSTYTTRTLSRIELGSLLLLAVQYAVLGGIAAFIVLAAVNTLLGTPADSPAYGPYQGS